MHYRKTLAFCGVAFLGLHFSATLIHLSPPNPIKEATPHLLKSYIAENFSQNWLLFAPEPSTSSRKIWFRCKPEGKDWTTWYDPMANVLREHQKTRITYRGKLLYVLQGIASETNRNLITQTSKTSPETAQPFQLAKRAAIAACTARFKKEQRSERLASIQFMTASIQTRNFSDRTKEKRFGKISPIEFKPVNL